MSLNRRTRHAMLLWPGEKRRRLEIHTYTCRKMTPPVEPFLLQPLQPSSRVLQPKSRPTFKIWLREVRWLEILPLTSRKTILPFDLLQLHLCQPSSHLLRPSSRPALMISTRHITTTKNRNAARAPSHAMTLRELLDSPRSRKPFLADPKA